MVFLVLLMKGFHATFEIHLQPLPAMNWKKFHPFRYIATFINTSNDVSKGIPAGSTEVCFPACSAIMVGDVASAESELANAIVESGFLQGCD